MTLAFVRPRHTGNPKFFEQMRDRLLSYVRDLTVIQATVVAAGSAREVEVLELVLQSQLAAQGFLRDRQFHKALCLGETCVELVDSLAASGVGGLLFWRILCRANLGDAYLRFRQTDHARDLLKQALELTEQQSPMEAGQSQSDARKRQISRERIVMGACYAHLSRIHLDAEENDEALRYTDLTVEVFERFIWDLGSTKEDREAMGVIVATSYANRCVCDIRRSKFESALAWLARAQECVEKHQDLSRDSIQVLAMLKEQISHTRSLQL
mmetsp:Transcript_10730/g.18664  ORF Transcript_10730/g.18664 Transcript_10730/m.18664 type:complete len:269 (+) Transcript_10730:2-808(+)